MRTRARPIAGFLFLPTCRVSVTIVAFVAGVASAAGQTVFAGADPSSGDYVSGPAVIPPGLQTSFTFLNGASGTGTLTSATFGWSAISCRAAVKLKFLRFDGTPTLRYLGERGPFDVTPAPIPAGMAVTIVTVPLVPPVPIEKNDFIGITNVTACGGPVWMNLGHPIPFPVPPFSSTFAGDVRSDIPPNSTISTSDEVLFVSARGPAAPAVSVPAASIPGLALLAGLLALAGFLFSRK